MIKGLKIERSQRRDLSGVYAEETFQESMQLSDSPIAFIEADQSTIKPRILKHEVLEQNFSYNLSMQRRPKDKLKRIQTECTRAGNTYIEPIENISIRKNQVTS